MSGSRQNQPTWSRGQERGDQLTTRSAILLGLVEPFHRLPHRHPAGGPSPGSAEGQIGTPLVALVRGAGYCSVAHSSLLGLSIGERLEKI